MVKRLAIYAAYDADGEVDYADIYYLQGLKKVVDNIIYVTDNPLNEGEAEKLSDLCCYVEAHRHGEYDFGSYKRGFQYAQKQGMLADIDELVFCNDSCYAPINPFTKMFETMALKTCDYWGITKNVEFYPHVQSFFLVFRPSVFLSDKFAGFMERIEKQKSVQDVILYYEVGLSRFLDECGFKSLCYIDYPKDFEFSKSCKNLTVYPIWLIRQGCPILKKKAICQFSSNHEGIFKTCRYVRKVNRLVKVNNPWRLYLYLILAYSGKVLSRFVWQKKITKSGKMLIKVFKIPVICRKIRQG